MVRDCLEPLFPLSAEMARKFPHSSKGGHCSQNNTLSPNQAHQAQRALPISLVKWILANPTGLMPKANTAREGDAPSPTHPRGWKVKALTEETLETLVQIFPLSAVIWTCINSQCARRKVSDSVTGHTQSLPLGWMMQISVFPQKCSDPETSPSPVWWRVITNKAKQFHWWERLGLGHHVQPAHDSNIPSWEVEFRSPQTEVRINLRFDTPQSTLQWCHLCLQTMAGTLITTPYVKGAHRSPVTNALTYQPLSVQQANRYSHPYSCEKILAWVAVVTPANLKLRNMLF